MVAGNRTVQARVMLSLRAPTGMAGDVAPGFRVSVGDPPGMAEMASCEGCGVMVSRMGVRVWLIRSASLA